MPLCLIAYISITRTSEGCVGDDLLHAVCFTCSGLIYKQETWIWQSETYSEQVKQRTMGVMSCGGSFSLPVVLVEIHDIVVVHYYSDHIVWVALLPSCD